MTSTHGGNSPDEDVHLITPAERIKELCSIDTSITRALREAGLAIEVLSGQRTQSDGIEGAGEVAEKRALSLGEAKQSFQEHSTTFLSTLQTISAQLRRQVFALEEAGIISAANNPPEPSAPRLPRPVAKNASAAKPLSVKEEPVMAITNGGLGNLDVGWLNSRRDEVARRKEAELWKEGKDVLRHLLQQTRAGPDETDGIERAAEIRDEGGKTASDDEDDLIIED